MSWKLWTKHAQRSQAKTLELPTDLYAFSIFAGALYVRSSVPFDDWRLPEVKVPEPLASVFERIAQGFQVWAWAVLVNEKFGIQASRLSLDVFCLQAFREGKTSDARVLRNFILEIGGVAARAARIAEIGEGQSKEMPWTHFAANEMLVESAKQLKCEESEMVFGGNDTLLGRCISHAIDRAQEVFAVMLRNVSYTSDNYVEWIWSEQPGARERHLQRRWNNPLFTHARRIVSAAEVHRAWNQDSATYDQLEAKVQTFLNAQPNELPLDWSRWCNDTRAGADELIEEAYRTGGGIGEIVSALQYVRARAIGTWRAGLNSESTERAALEHAEKEMQSWQCMRNEFVQQSMNSDLVPDEELLPALLSESIDNVHAFCEFLQHTDKSHLIGGLHSAALDLVRSAIADSPEAAGEHAKWKERLAVIAKF